MCTCMCMHTQTNTTLHYVNDAFNIGHEPCKCLMLCAKTLPLDEGR